MSLQFLEECTPEQIGLIESLEGLLAIPSVKGQAEIASPFGVETAHALHYMLNLGKDMGFSTCDLDGYAGYIEFGEGEKEIAMLCHLDVVPAGEGWKFDPFTPFIEKGRLFARGASDDKGPAMTCLYAMKSLKDQGYVPPCRIRLILGLDEESGSRCMAHYKAGQALPDLGFTPDAEFPVIFAEKGILHITIQGSFENPFPASDSIILLAAKGGERTNMIPASCTLSWIENPKNSLVTGIDQAVAKSETVRGIPGHASMPEFGENAISKAMAHIGSLLESGSSSHPFVDFYNSSIGVPTDGSLLGISFADSDSGQLTCNTGLLDLTAESVSMTLDIRYPVTADAGFIVARIRSKCLAAGLEVAAVQDNPPLFVDKNSAFVQALSDVYKEVTHKDAAPVAIGGGTYARSMPNVVAFGPTFAKEDDVAHQSGEYVKLDDLFLCHEIFQKAIVALAGLATA